MRLGMTIAKCWLLIPDVSLFLAVRKFASVKKDVRTKNRIDVLPQNNFEPDLPAPIFVTLRTAFRQILSSHKRYQSIPENGKSVRL